MIEPVTWRQLVIALSKTHLLPDALVDWLERWAERRQLRDAALMLLCPEEPAGPMSSRERWGINE